MNNTYLTDGNYDLVRDWIRRKRRKNISWPEIYFACKKDNANLEIYLERQHSDNDWPELTVDEWHDLVGAMEDADKRSEAMLAMSRAAQLNDGDENTDFYVPTDPNSAWQLYRKHLINDEHFTVESVKNIEESCLAILKRMSRNTTETGPVKGLVIGNVQSGKTANMAGLMAMSADWGWNVFIVLSGTIESLRKQTQTRLYNDLNRLGNLHWNSYDHLHKGMHTGQRAQDLSLEPNSGERYLTVVLKVRSRLKNMIEWIEDDRQKIQNMKVLVIDDEADQASINTADVYSQQERKTINRLILNLVHCRNHAANNDKDNTYTSHYQGMNYISYTATPYANCLNEIGKDTLYPQNFMKTLPVSPDYFGPKQIFGIKDADAKTLDIVREVDKKDVAFIREYIHGGYTAAIPDSLRDAILWFICVAAVMRSRNFKKPVSMLIHTSQKQDDHSNVAEAVGNWIIKNRTSIPGLCKELYEAETLRLTKDQLFDVMPGYSVHRDEVWDYPEYSTILPHITELIAEITPIRLDDEGELTYTKHIHLCIDNCKNNGIKGGDHMRLAYPDEKSPNKPDYATAFIVIGGNTLSRGLTISGLVSTFFLRTVKQADTLMQMGRWFGYRKHYELLPRIWMPEEAKNKFEFLADLDFDLRDQIYQMALQGLTPSDFRPALINSPKVSWMRLTSKNKMQSAVDSVYYGMDTQLTVYSTKKSDMRNNIAATVNLLSKLGKSRPAYKGNAFVWDSIPFSTIKKEFFDAGFKVPHTSTAFQEIDALAEWVEEMTKTGKLSNWNVVVNGNIINDNTPENEIWTLPGGERIAMIHRSATSVYEDRINIGVLSSKRDYIADIKEEQLSAETWKSIDKDINNMYRSHRRNAGMEDVPVFLIYRISRNSDVGKSAKTDRAELKLDEDLIGITLVTPTVTGVGEKQRVRIKTTGIDASEI